MSDNLSPDQFPRKTYKERVAEQKAKMAKAGPSPQARSRSQVDKLRNSGAFNHKDEEE